MGRALLGGGALILDQPRVAPTARGKSGLGSLPGNKQHTGTPGKGRLFGNNPLDNVCEPSQWASSNRMFFCVPY